MDTETCRDRLVRDVHRTWCVVMGASSDRRHSLQHVSHMANLRTFVNKSDIAAQ